MDIDHDELVSERFMEPLISLVNGCHNFRKCDTLSDEKFVRFGIERCLSNDESGRDFIQSNIKGDHKHKVSRADYFEQLKSNRRASMVIELGWRLEHVYREKLLPTHDVFAAIPELEGVEIYAGDGHFIKHATHDPKRVTSKGSSYVPVGHYYYMCLRTGWLELLDSSTDTFKKHDMRVIKAADPKVLTKNKKGTIIVWDKAGWDIEFWEMMKRKHGACFISTKKENFVIHRQGNWPWDRSNERNQGVVSDEYVGVGQASFRLITYIDPETGTKYEFLTNNTKYEPGVIAHIYKHRWDIEKRFDQTENKMHENKAWSKSRTGKLTQARLTALAHNLMLIFQQYLEETHGITEVKVEKRFTAQMKKRIKRAKEAGRYVPALTILLRRKPTQMTLQFIRWLRKCFEKGWRLVDQLGAIRSLSESYI